MAPTLHQWIAYIPSTATKTLDILSDYILGGTEQHRRFGSPVGEYAIARLGTDVYKIGELLDDPAIAEELSHLILRDNELDLRVLDLTDNRSNLWIVDNSEVDGKWSSEPVENPDGLANYIEIGGSYYRLPVAEVIAA